MGKYCREAKGRVGNKFATAGKQGTVDNHWGYKWGVKVRMFEELLDQLKRNMIKFGSFEKTYGG